MTKIIIFLYLSFSFVGCTGQPPSQKNKKNRNLIDWGITAIDTRLDTVPGINSKLREGVISRDKTKDDELFTVDVLLLKCCYYDLDIEFRENRLILLSNEVYKTDNCKEFGHYRLKYLVFDTDKVQSVSFEVKPISR